MLRTIRDLARPLVSPAVEYTIRRKIYSAMGTQAVTPYSRLVHATVWKAGSQYVRLVLSDPRIYRYSGALPYVWRQILDDPRARRSLLNAKRSVLTAAYASREWCTELYGSDEFRSIFIMRDPRALLVSWYFSTRYSHGPREAILRHREAMQDMSDQEGIEYALTPFSEEFLPILQSWSKAADREDVLAMRFEDLVGQKGPEVWAGIFAYLGIQAPEDVIARVTGTYSIKNLQRPTKEGQIDKYSAGAKRKWSTYMTDGIEERLRSEMGAVLPRFGYI